MLETALRDDALTITSGGFNLRVGLPWIRSMPLSSISGFAVEIDGTPMAQGDLTALLGERSIPVDSLAQEPGWWFIQDRLVVSGRHGLLPGIHAVAVDFQLLVPYLQARPGSPLVLPFHLEAQLDTRRPSMESASRDVA